MNREKFVLTDRKRNAMALSLLRKLSTEVDQLREQLRKAKPGRVQQRLYQDYLLTVQGDTDSSANRERRRQLLKGVLWSLFFERKDEKRTFSIEQRRILWNSDQQRMCSKCKRPIVWLDVSVDHVRAYTQGGRKLGSTNCRL
jgi:hypothetical protein